ncbi:MAG: hypothetical protein ACR2HG_10280 [Pyrinomonadaceae bacterium]
MAISSLKIIKLQSLFYTNTDDKEKGNGIAESYYWGNMKICGNTGWAKDIRFPEYVQNEGQMFEVDIAAEKCSDMRYNIITETDDIWDVTIYIYAWYGDGTKKRTGGATLLFGGKHRMESIPFITC